jgi:hypothetical protein
MLKKTGAAVRKREERKMTRPKKSLHVKGLIR